MVSILVLVIGVVLAVLILSLVVKVPGTPAKGAVAGLALVVLVAAMALASVRYVDADEVGIVVKHFGGPSLKQGRIIATNGENGVQAAVLAPGWHLWYWPGMFDVRTAKLTEIESGKVGMVEARDGRSLPEGQLFASEMGDAEAFRTMVEDGRHFLTDGGGFRGMQTSVLKPGRYRINTELFKVTPVPQTEVLAGEVAVLTANFGKPASRRVKIDAQGRVTDLEAGAAAPAEPVADAAARREEAVMAMAGPGEKGIRMAVLPPGKYDLNPQAFTVRELWTTKMIAQYTKEHAGTPTSRSDGSVGSSDRRRGGGEAGADGRGGAGGQVSAAAQDEREITVRTSDGFEFPVDVRVEYFVRPENAPIVVARLGDDEGDRFRNALNSAVRATFRNAAEKVRALEYVQNRSGQEQAAIVQLEREMAPFGVTVTAVRIGQVYGSTQLDKLLATQTEREVTRQELLTVQEKQRTAEQQKELSRTTQEAEEEKRLATAAYAVKIAEEEKKRAVIAATAEAEATTIRAEAQAEAYRVIAQQIGAGNAALVEILKIVGERAIQITPRVMVTQAGGAAGAGSNGGGGNGGGSAETTALIGTMLDSMLGRDEVTPAAGKPAAPAGKPAGPAPASPSAAGPTAARP